MKTLKYMLLAVVLLSAAFMCRARHFHETDITVYNTAGGVRLGGTLTTPPDGTAPKAALVLATGSGAQNRDEEVMGHRPFKVIAEYLSENGYAVLRMDDRGVGESTGNAADATSDTMTSDMAAAIVKLDSIVGVGIAKGVLGHSEGGSVAIKAANRIHSCRFIITLAAPAWAGDSIIMSQARALALAMSGRFDGEARQRKLMDIVKSPLPSSVVQGMIYAELAQPLGDAATLPQVRQQLQATAATMAAPSYRSIVQYDPTADISAVRVPWLALNGEKDVQVLPANLQSIAELNPSAHTVLLPGHNHLFQRCTTGLVQEYASLPEDISDIALEAILSWLDSIFDEQR